jgi:hypothetical protein
MPFQSYQGLCLKLYPTFEASYDFLHATSTVPTSYLITYNH